MNGESQALFNALSMAGRWGVGGGCILSDTLLLPVYDDDLTAETAQSAEASGYIAPDVSASDRKIGPGISQVLIPLMMHLSGYLPFEASRYVKAYWPEGATEPLTRIEFIRALKSDTLHQSIGMETSRRPRTPFTNHTLSSAPTACNLLGYSA